MSVYSAEQCVNQGGLGEVWINQDCLGEQWVNEGIFKVN